MTTITNIHKAILEKIEQGAIRQKPKWYFVLLTLMTVFGGVALVALLLYVISFTSLVLRERFVLDAFSFGPLVAFEIVHTVPLLLIVLVITIALILHVLVRHFAFAYTKPVVVTLGAGFALVFVLFILVLIFDAESRIGRLGEGKHVPGVGLLHERFRGQSPIVPLRGTVVALGDGSCTIRTEEGEVVARVHERTKQDPSVTIGSSVVALTERTPEGLVLVGIRIDDGTTPSPKPRPDVRPPR